MEYESGHGIWEELKSNHPVSNNWFDIVAVDVTQFERPISEQVGKIHCRFVVCGCDLLLPYFK